VAEAVVLVALERLVLVVAMVVSLPLAAVAVEWLELEPLLVLAVMVQMV
jgi:hypothetical protein